MLRGLLVLLAVSFWSGIALASEWPYLHHPDNPESSDCPPVNVANGITKYSGTDGVSRVGDRVEIKCISGYSLQGFERAMCKGTGEWGELPECVMMKCQRPLKVEGALVRYTSLRIGSVAVYECEKGREMDGSPTAICEADGRWSMEPSCFSIVAEQVTPGAVSNCGPPPDINNARVTVAGAEPSLIAYYDCVRGYFLADYNSITCRGHGRWSLPYPRCVPDYSIYEPPSTRAPTLPVDTIFTPVPVWRPPPTESFSPPPLNDPRTDKGPCAGQNVHVQIDAKAHNPGFILSPYRASTQLYYPNDMCTWVMTASQGLCVRLTLHELQLSSCVDADRLQVVEEINGQMTETQTYCGSNAEPAPQLTSLSETVTLHFRTNDKVEGYGFSIIFEEVGCGSAGGSAGAVRPQPDSTQPPDIVTPPPSQLTTTPTWQPPPWKESEFPDRGGGSSSSNSASNGNTGGNSNVGGGNVDPSGGLQSPSTNCGEPLIKTNHGVIQSPGYSGGRYPPSQLCTWVVRAPLDKLIKVTFTAIDIELSESCLKDRVAVYDGSSFFSLSMGSFCGQGLPRGPLMSSGHDILVVFSSDTTVSGRGFSLEYEFSNGYSCGPAPQIPHATSTANFGSANQSVPGSRVAYTCAQGYSPQGHEVIVCTPQGEWTARPMCKKTGCPAIEAIPHVTVSNLFFANNAIGGDMITYQCEPGYIAVSPALITCLEDGRWSHEPRCEKTCYEPLKLVAATSERSWEGSRPSRPGDYVTYRCQPNHQMYGDPRVTCSDEGLWGNPPRCLQSCGDYPTPQNGRKIELWAGRNSLPGDQLVVMCNLPYTIGGGSPLVVCSSDGQWSSFPTCS